jgi:hypothetical protein
MAAADKNTAAQSAPRLESKNAALLTKRGLIMGFCVFVFGKVNDDGRSPEGKEGEETGERRKLSPPVAHAGRSFAIILGTGRQLTVASSKKQMGSGIKTEPHCLTDICGVVRVVRYCGTS